MELVQEIHHLLMDREDTCHRTCFSLQLNGVTLDNFAELKNIDGLADGSVIRVVEEPYTVREARIHVRHVRDLLKSLDPVDAYNGMDCNSLSFLSAIAQGDVMGQSAPPFCPFSPNNHAHRSHTQTDRSASLMTDRFIDILLFALLLVAALYCAFCFWFCCLLRFSFFSLVDDCMHATVAHHIFS